MDRKTILAFLLIGLIIILMPYYYQIFMPPPSKTVQQDTLSVPAPTEPNLQEEQDLKSDLSTQKKFVSDKTIQTEDIEETEFILETDLYIARISNINGGTIKSFVLKKYQTRTREDTFRVELIPENSPYLPFLLEFISMNGDSIVMDNPSPIIYTSVPLTEGENVVINGDQAFRIKCRTNLGEGSFIEKELVFHGNNYILGMTITSQGLKEQIPTREYRVSWKSGLRSTEPNFGEDMTYARAHAYLGEELETIDAKMGKRSQSSLDGSVDWVAIRTKYFVSAIIPRKPASSFLLQGIGIHLLPNEKKPFKLFSMAIDIPLASDRQSDDFIVYLGPLDYKAIHSLGVHLERIMNFGMSLIRPISKGILNLFIAMHKAIPNYGIVLIIFAIIVKLVLYPLTHKSFESMKQMQSLQPLIVELREKYKDDPKRLQAETMRLYKEYKINPLGGCLPMFLQLPLLWALFIVFRTTIELRNAPFFWWITDLSAPDTVFVLPFSLPIYGNTVNILPIVMAVTMIFQQKMSSTTTTPQQKYMMYFMPVFLFLLFNQFPSGLNLYYTLFNVLSIFQQKYLVKTPEIELKPLHEKGKNRKHRKR